MASENLPSDCSGKVDSSAEPVTGEMILNEIHAFLGRFVAYPSPEAQVAHVLWIAHTHLMEAWESTPRLAFLSPEPGSGKTRALEITELLVPRPVEAINVSPAYLIRKIGGPDGSPTILHDEIDAIFGPRARENEDIRALINAGHRRGAVVGRCVKRGNEMETVEMPAYCAVALAGIGNLPDTILSRSVIIRMRRRSPHEHVEPYRRRVHSAEGRSLRARLEGWVGRIGENIAEVWPALPPEVHDRDADVWEPLLCVADAVGGDWPERARRAAVTLVTLLREENPSVGIRLLSDVRKVFGSQTSMMTSSLVKALVGIEDSIWGDPGGISLDDRKLATILRTYDVRPKVLRFGDQTVRGYDRADLVDPWDRYLGPVAGRRNERNS